MTVCGANRSRDVATRRSDVEYNKNKSHIDNIYINKNKSHIDPNEHPTCTQIPTHKYILKILLKREREKREQ